MTWLKVDLHTHTSEDPQDRISYNAHQLIDKAALKGFDALAITNHDFVLYNDELVQYAEKKDILLIPGMELTLSKKHVLLINPDFTMNPKGRSLADLEKIKKDTNLIIAPHPFFPQFKSLKSKFFHYLTSFDAVEYSHCYNRILNLNRKAVKEAEKKNLPLVGTSDCHFLWEFGTTYSLVDAEKTIISIIEAVKKGRVRIVTTPLSIILSFRLFMGMFQVKLINIFSSRKQR